MMNGGKSTEAPLPEEDTVTVGCGLPSHPRRTSPSGMWRTSVIRGMVVDGQR